jgi:hypothetical protein
VAGIVARALFIFSSFPKTKQRRQRRTGGPREKKKETAEGNKTMQAVFGRQVENHALSIEMCLLIA